MAFLSAIVAFSGALLSTALSAIPPNIHPCSDELRSFLSNSTPEANSARRAVPECAQFDDQWFEALSSNSEALCPKASLIQGCIQGLNESSEFDYLLGDCYMEEGVPCLSGEELSALAESFGSSEEGTDDICSEVLTQEVQLFDLWLHQHKVQCDPRMEYKEEELMATDSGAARELSTWRLAGGALVLACSRWARG